MSAVIFFLDCFADKAYNESRAYGTANDHTQKERSGEKYKKKVTVMKTDSRQNTAEPWRCDILSRQRSALMGISILLILLFHFTEDCEIYEVHYSGFIKWFKTYVGSSSVDTFLFLSGLGLYYSMKKNPDVFGFYRRRLVKVLIPYLLVAVPSWCILDLVLNHEGILRMMQDLAFATFFTDGVRWFWYIGAILVCYLAYPAIFAFVDRCQKRALRLGVLVILCVAVTAWAVWMWEYRSELFGDINIVLLRIPPFLAGCFYGRASYEKKRGARLWMPAAILSVLFVRYVPDARSPVYDRYALAAANISLSSCAAVLLDRLPADMLVFRVLGWFGAHSLELYLTHVAIRKIMCELGYLTCYVMNEAVMLILAILSAWLLQRLSGWIAKKI